MQKFFSYKFLNLCLFVQTPPTFIHLYTKNIQLSNHFIETLQHNKYSKTNTSQSEDIFPFTLHINLYPSLCDISRYAQPNFPTTRLSRSVSRPSKARDSRSFSPNEIRKPRFFSASNWKVRQRDPLEAPRTRPGHRCWFRGKKFPLIIPGAQLSSFHFLVFRKSRNQSKLTRERLRKYRFLHLYGLCVIFARSSIKWYIVFDL